MFCKSKKAFTLIEMMAVLAIIGILLGLVVTAVSGSMKASRRHKANAVCKVVQQGIETYRAQKDKWPGSVGDKIDSGNVLSRTNSEGEEYTSDNNKYVLSSGEVRDMIKTIVNESVNNNNPLMDISGLFVSRSSGESGSKGYGMDFWEAVRGTKESPKKMSLGEMYFGYPEESRGYFRRFKIVYSVPTDSMEVMKQ